MREFDRTPSLAHMAMLYGIRTERELDRALAPFFERCAQYRRRYEQDRNALSHDEAVEAYKLVAPLCMANPDREYAERRAVMSAITFPCMQTGGFGFREPAVTAILDGFEREMDSREPGLYLLHIGENEPRRVKAWDRYVAFLALRHFVDVLDHDGRTLTGVVREAYERAQAILDTVTVKRPRGRFDERDTAARDSFIVVYLDAMRGCGLSVTTGLGPAMSEALESVGVEVSARVVRKVWEETPALFRPDKRTREFFALDVACVRCQKLKVPTWRAGTTRLCLACSPPSF